MAAERHAPDALLDQTGLTGALTAIDEDPDSDGGDWLTTSNNTATVCRTSFPTPTAAPTDGVDLQEFRCLVRKTDHSTDPDVRVELYENGSLVSTPIADQALSSTTGVVLSAKWDSVSLGTGDGSLVEVRVVGTPGGGSPGNRASVEVGAVEWNAEVTAAAAGGDGDAVLALAALGLASTADYIAPSSAAATAALAALSLSATADYIAPSSAAVTAGLGALGIAATADYIEPSSAAAIAGLSPLVFSATGVSAMGAPVVFHGSRAIFIGIRI